MSHIWGFKLSHIWGSRIHRHELLLTVAQIISKTLYTVLLFYLNVPLYSCLYEERGQDRKIPSALPQGRIFNNNITLVFLFIPSPHSFWRIFVWKLTLQELGDMPRFPGDRILRAWTTVSPVCACSANRRQRRRGAHFESINLESLFWHFLTLFCWTIKFTS